LDYNISLAISGALFVPAVFFALKLPEHSEISYDSPSGDAIS